MCVVVNLVSALRLSSLEHAKKDATMQGVSGRSCLAPRNCTLICREGSGWRVDSSLENQNKIKPIKTQNKCTSPWEEFGVWLINPFSWKGFVCWLY